ASRRAASSRVASTSGWTCPPGKATSPRCDGIVSGRRVSTTRVSPPASKSGTSTAAAWFPGTGGACAGCCGAGKLLHRRRTSSSGSRRASGGRPAHGAGPPSRIVGGRGILCVPARRALTSVGRLELRRQLLQQLLQSARLQVGHDLPGRGLAPLPLHPGGEQLGRVDRGLLHGASVAGGRDVSGGFAAPPGAKPRAPPEGGAPAPPPAVLFEPLEAAHATHATHAAHTAHAAHAAAGHGRHRRL